MPTGARAPLLPCGTEVSVEKCFPLDDVPARSADCISWGPHNVLQVCTRWAVSMYLGNLLTPACQRSVRNHPLAHRDDGESVEVVVGAKWSTALLPEVYYPASARLCVQTTSNLVVYRVSRHGANRVVSSHGIGIACFRGGLARLPFHGDGTAAEASQKELHVPRSPAAKQPAIGRRSAGAAKVSVKSTSTKKMKPVSRTASTATGRKRGRSRNSPTPTTNSTSDDESASSSSSALSSRTPSSSSNSSRHDTDASSESKPPMSRLAPRSGASVAGEGKGTHAHEDAMLRCVDARERWRPPTATNAKEFSATPTESDDVSGVLDYLWLDQDDLLVLTCKGLHVVALSGHLSDEDAPVTLSLPTPLYRWGAEDEVAKLGFRGPAPLCMTTLFTDGLSAAAATATALKQLRRIVIIASPYMLRIMHVTSQSPEHSATMAHLAYIVEVPSLTSVPTSVCAVAVQRTGQTTTRTEHPPPGLEVDTVVFVSAPGAVLRGRFALGALSSFSDSASPAPYRRTVCQTDAHYGLDALRGEVCLRRLMVVPFVAHSRVTGTDAGNEGDCPTSPSPSLGHASVAVLGIGEKSVHMFLVCGPSSTALLRCPLLAGCSEMPPRTCAGIVGVALHPSGTLAVAAVQSGQASHEPTHLWPVSVDTCGGWLSRLVELGAFVPEAVAGTLHEASAPERAVAPYELRGSTLRCMLQQQTSTSFFLHEQLFPGSGAQSSEVHQYAQAHQQARQLPSTETIQAYRRWMMPGGMASSQRPCLAAMPARRRYLQLRAQFGVDVFLRWPLQVSTVACDSASGMSSVFVSPPSMEVMQASWLWWVLLRHICVLCPWDRPVVSELVLSNAVRILAKRYRYANMKPEGSEHFRDHAATMGGSACCSTRPDALDVDGAIAFVEAYIKAQKAALRKDSSHKQATSLSSFRLITVADCGGSVGPGRDDERSPREALTDASRPVAQLHWCVSSSWVSSLQTFLEATAYSNRRSAGLSSPSGSDASETASPHLFPCSLCDRPACVAFHLSLSSTSTHVPAGESSVTKGNPHNGSPASHTTLFSGSTLSPLSFFSESYVLTRCLACGLSDFAEGPRCRVCGGLLE
ncbi:hypothetical protein JKF63_00810 [Porcisia hertigi]|uniref:Uncharacterized protein n=1 Tax=Porcisia hertigi TaxID=2761500 RepID=A0A836L7A9_9TRYP|nr:hypothetical protein JKF63_00810 [Porcisia hertigi]